MLSDGEKIQTCVVTHRHAVVWCHTGTQLCKLTNCTALRPKKEPKCRGVKIPTAVCSLHQHILLCPKRDLLKEDLYIVLGYNTLYIYIQYKR